VLYFNPIPYVKIFAFTEIFVSLLVCLTVYSVDYNVTAEFTPTLTAYIVTDYTQNQILRAAIQSPPIWSQNLTALDTITTWTLSKDSATGDFHLIQDQVAATVQSDVVTSLNNSQIVSARVARGGLRR
jgi:hypothetical protein